MSGATLIAAGLGLLAGAALEAGRRAILDPAPFLDDDELVDDWGPIRPVVPAVKRRPRGAVTTRHLTALPSTSPTSSTTTSTDPQESQP